MDRLLGARVVDGVACDADGFMTIVGLGANGGGVGGLSGRGYEYGSDYAYKIVKCEDDPSRDTICIRRTGRSGSASGIAFYYLHHGLFYTNERYMSGDDFIRAGTELPA
jgi:hypothetical protein